MISSGGFIRMCPVSATSRYSTARIMRTSLSRVFTISCPKACGRSATRKSTSSRSFCPQGHDHFKFFLYISPGGTARALPPASRRPQSPMEDQRVRLQRARLWDDYVRPTRPCSSNARPTRAMVRHPVEPQMVPQSRRLADHRRDARRTSNEAAAADRRSCPDPQGLSRGIKSPTNREAKSSGRDRLILPRV